MNGPLLLILVIVATGLLFVVAPVVADAYARYRSGEALKCPETHGNAEVTLNNAKGHFRRGVWQVGTPGEELLVMAGEKGLRGKVRQGKLACAVMRAP